MGFCNYNKPSIVLAKELNMQIANFNSGPMLQGKETHDKMEKIKKDYNEAIKLLDLKGL